MSEVLGQESAGLTADLYHPVIGEPVGDPTPQPEAAPEAAEVQPSPVVYEIPSWDGQVYKTVTADKVPQVIRDQDTHIRNLHEKIAFYERSTGAQQPQQQPQQTADAAVEARAASIRQAMIASGFEDNPQFAKFQAARELEIAREAKDEVRSTYERQQTMNEYQTLVQSNPDLDVDANPLSRAVYEKHKPNSPIEHLALVRFYQGLIPQQQQAQQQPVAQQPQQQLPAQVQAMFHQPNRQQQFARPPATASAPPRTGGDPAHVTESIRQTLSFLNVTADSPRGQRAIAEIRASANGGVR